MLKDYLKVSYLIKKTHIISVEYPGYGLYLGRPDEEKILRDAETIYDYLTETLKIKE